MVAILIFSRVRAKSGFELRPLQMTRVLAKVIQTFKDKLDCPKIDGISIEDRDKKSTFPWDPVW